MKPPTGSSRHTAGERPDGRPGEQSNDTSGERPNGKYRLPEGSVPKLMPMGRFELAALRPGARAALALSAAVVVAVVVVAILSGGGSPRSANAAGHAANRTPRHLAATRMPATKKMATTKTMASTMDLTTSALYKAVAGVNQSTTGKGLLPISSCKPMSTTMITCTAPHYAIDAVNFQTFSSLPALYAAYETRVSKLAGGPFRANFSDCSRTSTNGEIAWNHDFEHTRKYPLSMFTSGKITDDKAAGRMYCTFNNDLLYVVWTQDDGRVLAELAGAPHFDAFQWWVGVHHSIVFPGMPAMPGMTG